MQCVPDDAKIVAALNAAKVAATFMELQMSGFSLMNFVNDPPIGINWPIYYQFAAGVYDCLAQASERHNGYGQETSIAALPAFVNDDLEAASKVFEAMRRPSLYSNRGGTECALWLQGKDGDRFSLARSLGAYKPSASGQE